MIACGPSLQQTHVDTESYERCYAADHDPAVSRGAREACWQHWLAEHASTQPPKRIKFAEKRLEALSAGGETRPLPDQEPAVRPLFEHEYPPASPGARQTSGCDPLCEQLWSDCTNRCEIRDVPCKTACESEFRVCLSGCP